MERKGEGLTTEDLAGARTSDDPSVEEVDRTEGERREAGPAEAEHRREPIPAGPAAETPIILDERERPDAAADERLTPDAPAPPSDTAPERVDLGEGAGEQGKDDAFEVAHAAGPLIADADREEFMVRWREVQFRFVEEPRSAVQEADGLVAEVMQRLAQMFADERANLESQWSHGDKVSTENLRVAFQRYRAFFDRLLET